MIDPVDGPNGDRQNVVGSPSTTEPARPSTVPGIWCAVVARGVVSGSCPPSTRIADSTTADSASVTARIVPPSSKVRPTGSSISRRIRVSGSSRTDDAGSTRSRASTISIPLAAVIGTFRPANDVGATTHSPSEAETPSSHTSPNPTALAPSDASRISSRTDSTPSASTSGATSRSSRSMG